MCQVKNDYLIVTNTSNSYYLSKSHTCHITSSVLQHVFKMSSFSMNASDGCWRHSPTVYSTATGLKAAQSLLMHHFSSSTYNFKMNTINAKCVTVFNDFVVSVIFWEYACALQYEFMVVDGQTMTSNFTK